MCCGKAAHRPTRIRTELVPYLSVKQSPSAHQAAGPQTKFEELCVKLQLNELENLS